MVLYLMAQHDKSGTFDFNFTKKPPLIYTKPNMKTL